MNIITECNLVIIVNKKIIKKEREKKSREVLSDMHKEQLTTGSFEYYSLVCPALPLLL